METNDIIITDYRSYIIDFNFEEYFCEQFSDWDQINYYILNPARRSHRIKFVKKLEEVLDSITLEIQIDRLYI